MVKKVKTLKSGYFTFSQKYDNDHLKDLLSDSRFLYNSIIDLPILPRVFSQLEEEIIRRSIHGTAALEGNPLSEEQVGEIISHSDKTQYTERVEREIVNLEVAYEILRDITPSEQTYSINEKIIKNIHKVITNNIKSEGNEPGRYRNYSVKVGDKEHGGTYTPPKIYKDIEVLMKECIEFVNCDEIIRLDPVLRAALAHYHFARIHPFGDGNGRTARLIEALLIQVTGIKYFPTMLSNYYYRNMDDYYWAFSLAGKNKENDVTPFLEFVLKGVIESLETIKGRIIGFIRTATLQEYFSNLKSDKQITRRQYYLLNILLKNPYPFSLSDLLDNAPFNILYRNFTERTARRDIKKLQKMNLLNVLKNGTYELNMRVLG